MKSFKKMISGFVCTCMVAGSLALPVYAAEDSVVYQVQDFSTGEILTTTQKDIDTGHWNTAVLGEDSPIVFEEFPVRMDSHVDYYGSLNITFEYLKTLGAGDYAELSLTDRYTGETYYTEELRENGIAEVKNAPVDRVFDVTISETIDGEEKVYKRIIQTEDRLAEMPMNVSLENVGETIGMQAHSLEIVELNEEDEKTVLDEEGNEMVFLEKRKTVSISPEELPEYYNSLPADKMYKIFAGAGKEEGMKTFEGFISTYVGGREKGIFMPGFSIYSEGDYVEIENSPQTFAVEERSTTKPPSGLTSSQIQREAVEYDYMNDRPISMDRNDGREFFIIKYTCPERMNYRFSVISSEDIAFEVWETENGTPCFSYDAVGNPNIDELLMTLAGREIYFVISFVRASAGTALFRIQAPDYVDTGNSYYDLIQEQKDNNVKTPCNQYFFDEVDYQGDVDVRFVDNTEDGKYVFRIESNADSKNVIAINIQRETKNLNGDSMVVTDVTKTVSQGRRITFFVKLDEGTNYFIQTKSNTLSAASIGDSLRGEIMNPFKKDVCEDNNTIETATEWDQREQGEITLHKEDVDYFTFSTDEKLYQLDASLTKVNNIAYNMKLIQLVNGSEKVLAQLEESPGLTQSMPGIDLEPNTRYYVRVDAKGLGSDAYMVDGDYKPMLERARYSIDAVLDKDVALQGETLEECLDQLTANMTVTAEVYRETKTLESAQVKKNTKLYYTADGAETELTDEAIQGLTAGEYPITAKVYGSTVYGGTIALTIAGSVEPPPVTGDIVELDTVQVESVLLPVWDWAACAKMMANSRLTREGQPVNTEVVKQAIVSVWGKTEIKNRRNIEDTAHMANYFYCGELESDNFDISDVLLEGAENAFAGAIRNGEAIIAYLAGTDIETSRYVLICGVDTTAHRYKIIDPTIGKAEWIPVEELHSGYRGDSNLKFTGQIIELL